MAGRICAGPLQPRHVTDRHPRAIYCWTCQEHVDLENDRRRKRAEYQRSKLARLPEAAKVVAT